MVNMLIMTMLVVVEENYHVTLFTFSPLPEELATFLLLRNCLVTEEFRRFQVFILATV